MGSGCPVAEDAACSAAGWRAGALASAGARSAAMVSEAVLEVDMAVGVVRPGPSGGRMKKKA